MSLWIFDTITGQLAQAVLSTSQAQDEDAYITSVMWINDQHLAAKCMDRKQMNSKLFLMKMPSTGISQMVALNGQLLLEEDTQQQQRWIDENYGDYSITAFPISSTSQAEDTFLLTHRVVEKGRTVYAVFSWSEVNGTISPSGSLTPITMQTVGGTTLEGDVRSLAGVHADAAAQTPQRQCLRIVFTAAVPSPLDSTIFAVRLCHHGDGQLDNAAAEPLQFLSVRKNDGKEGTLEGECDLFADVSMSPTGHFALVDVYGPDFPASYLTRMGENVAVPRETVDPYGHPFQEYNAQIEQRYLSYATPSLRFDLFPSDNPEVTTEALVSNLCDCLAKMANGCYGRGAQVLLNGYYVLPPGFSPEEHRYPVLMMCYGGPRSQTVTHRHPLMITNR